MARSGFAAVRAAKDSFEKQQAQWEGMRARDMRLVKSGDTAVLWFVGCEPDEPRKALVHTVSLGGNKGFSYELCAGKNCVYCYAAKKNDKRVKKPSNNFYFTVADSRWVHKEKDEEKSREKGRDVFSWNDCPRSDDEPNAPCKLCKRKVPRERGGRKKLRLGLTQAISLDNENTRLRRKCLSCGKGKVSITGYKRGKKIIESLDDVDEDEHDQYEAVLECSKCDDPQQGSIYACPIRMTRSGTGQTTTYSFTQDDDFQDPPDWVQEIEPFDWDKTNVPRSPENMADQLQIDNPFDEEGDRKEADRKKRAKGSDPYDDDEDDEEEDDEDSAFDKKAKKKKKYVEEDDDEEDDEEEDEDEEDDDE